MKNSNRKIGIISFILIILTIINMPLYGRYSYSDIQGIWVLTYTLPESDCPMIYGNHFLVFHKNYYLFIPTIFAECSALNDFGVFEYGFTEKTFWHEVDSLYPYGSNLAFINTNGDFDAWNYFYVEPKENMEFYNGGYSYMKYLPKKAQSVLYKRGLYDQRNYAREFLEYDICGIKVDNVPLLDSLQNATGTTIGKDDIVIVRDTTGDLLQVEYEPEPNKYIKGYLKREDLQFVETKK